MFKQLRNKDKNDAGKSSKSKSFFGKKSTSSAASAGTASSGTSAPTTPATRSPKIIFECHTCRQPIPSTTEHIHTTRPSTGDRHYHKDCFLCLHCHNPIYPGKQAFCFDSVPADAVATNGNGSARESSKGEKQEFPFHRECFADYFGWICVVCEQPLPITCAMGTEKGTQFSFLKHPFFEKERMCPHHVTPIDDSDDEETNEMFQMKEDETGNGSSATVLPSASLLDDEIGEIRRCAGCHRFEPLFASEDKHFIDVGDNKRCVCLACCRTIVTTPEDALLLWNKVVAFFEEQLGLVTESDTGMGVSRQDLKSIPILLVGSESLNDNLREHSPEVHYMSNQIMTRGLCLSECCAESSENLGVTAVMCLSGLPADLTASILAHEAMHAWFKLHPNFRYKKPLPTKVEEGICQLVAFLFLNDGLDPIFEEESDQKGDDSIPSDYKLRQYFKFCIETDEGLYGDGFRLAAQAYANMGIQELLYHIALTHDFPE